MGPIRRANSHNNESKAQAQLLLLLADLYNRSNAMIENPPNEEKSSNEPDLIADAGKQLHDVIKSIIKSGIDEDRTKRLSIFLQSSINGIKYQGTERAQDYISELISQARSADEFFNQTPLYYKLVGALLFLGGVLISTLGMTPLIILTAALLMGIGTWLAVKKPQYGLENSIKNLSTALSNKPAAIPMPDAKEEKSCTNQSVTLSYIPSKINLKELHYSPHSDDSGNVYHVTERNFILSLNLVQGRTKDSTLVQKGLVTARYDIIRHGDEYYSLYKISKNDETNRGSFGKTHFVQSFNNTFYILKVIKYHQEEYNKFDLTTEINGLQIAGQYKFHYERHNKKGELQYEILMELVPGIDLYSFLQLGESLSPLLLLDICINAIENVLRLHKEGLMHGDLGTQNAMLYIATLQLKLIDFGMSKSIGTDPNAKYVESKSNFVMFPDYAAPEVKENTFCLQSDTHSLAILLAKLLRLGFIAGTEYTKKYILATPETPRPKNTPNLSNLDPQVGFQITAHLKGSMSKDPADRTPLSTTHAFFKQVRRDYPRTENCTIPVVYLDIDYYYEVRNKPLEIAALMTAIKKSFVYLVDINGKNRYRYQRTKRALESYSVTCHPVIIQTSEENLENSLDQHRKENFNNGDPYLIEYFDKTNPKGKTLKEPQQDQEQALSRSA